MGQTPPEAAPPTEPEVEPDVVPRMPSELLWWPSPAVREARRRALEEMLGERG